MSDFLQAELRSEIAALHSALNQAEADCVIFMQSNGSLTSEVLTLRAELADARETLDHWLQAAKGGYFRGKSKAMDEAMDETIALQSHQRTPEYTPEEQRRIDQGLEPNDICD